MVGFPSTWLEINPSRLDFQPLVRNPTAGWYSTHWMVRIPTILPLHQIYHEQELPVCFDADAGGGRFLAIFGFLNRTDFDVKLHPFLLYEGSDSRMNMEMTLGKYSEEIAKLEGKQVLINGGPLPPLLVGWVFPLAPSGTVLVVAGGIRWYMVKGLG